jgi:hypothetical protein
MARTAQLEINDLAIRFEDVGMTPAGARKEAERIASVIAAAAYQKGFRDGQNTPKVTALSQLLEEGE